MNGEKVYIVKAFTRVAHTLRVSASSLQEAEDRAREDITRNMSNVWDKPTVSDVNNAEVTFLALEDGDST